MELMQMFPRTRAVLAGAGNPPLPPRSSLAAPSPCHMRRACLALSRNDA